MKLFVNIGAIAGIGTNTQPLRGAAMRTANMLHNAWLKVVDGHIADYGTMENLTEAEKAGYNIVDLQKGWLFPTFCDSHTHIVYAGERSGEFVDKINGLSYEEIARRGGGILNSADLLAHTSEEELYLQAKQRLEQMIAKGTGAVEIKSGYGLTVESELKMLRVIRRLRDSSAAEIRATFLGAHAVGRAFTGRQAEYVDLVVNEMIPAVGEQGLADFVDVFCDRGFFTPDETERILEAAARWGMRPKIHANELDASGGVQVGVKHGALSVDHLERAGIEETAILAQSATIATALPGASFFLNMPYAPGRQLIDAGAALAVASDYNPGSSPSGDMRFVGSLACIKMRLTPQEALNAATINGAAAMGVERITGSITPGKRADFFVTSPLPSLAYLFYAYTEPLIKTVYLQGRCVAGEE